MTNTAILVASGLLLFAYLLDIFGRRYRLPSVVLLLATGMVLRQVLDALGLHLNWVDPIVPVLGTLGLILIVLEGSLDLHVNRQRRALVGVAAGSALLGFTVTVAVFTLLFHYGLALTVPLAALAAIPFAVISSAVAIPSAGGFAARPREFVVYESSLSDIIGVLVFYAWLEANGSLGHFALNLFGGGVVSLIAAVLAALGIYYLIHRVEGHVRFLPLLAGLVFLYALGKAIHLSPLVLVLVAGLALNNPHLLEWNARLRAMHDDTYDQTLREFKGIVAELTFATKSFFFLLLGYWTEVSHMASWEAWGIAAAVVVTIYATRAVLLKLLRQRDFAQLLWIAPRGLITVLLFLSARHAGQLPDFPFGAVMLVVLATASLCALAYRGMPPVGDANPVPDPAVRVANEVPASGTVPLPSAGVPGVSPPGG